ncbi:ribosomal protein L22/L17 [Cantharellus anzutake]|uniref:ribosomal protein L22/L17 n=1 Tax=Cantharellus anzutake TaxID=1750568 RepID=UPI0019053491|nr:ribosomal protein L22/L17 [Cantharellus anzutake]KAF8338826.1 ribosomal protein L22/L17 [Cantharellus anzutake]
MQRLTGKTQIILCTRVLQSSSCLLARPRLSIEPFRPPQTPSTSRSIGFGLGQSVYDTIQDLTATKERPKETKEETEKAKLAQKKRGDDNLFDSLDDDFVQEVNRAKALAGPKINPKTGKLYTEHKYSTASFKMSHRKLNDLGRQIAGKPIDAAILQMEFSEKRASTRIKNMLCVARDHAQFLKGLNRSKLIVAEAWVEKGPKLKRIDIKGRGRSGIKEHPKSRLRVILREGKPLKEKAKEVMEYKLNKVRSAGLMREYTPIRNPGPQWAW